MNACYSVNPHPPILHHLVLTPPVSTRPGQPRDKLSWEELEAIRCDIYEASACSLDGTIPHLGLNCFVVLCCFCQRRQNEDITLPFIPLSLQLDLYLSRARALSIYYCEFSDQSVPGFDAAPLNLFGKRSPTTTGQFRPLSESWDLDFLTDRKIQKGGGWELLQESCITWILDGLFDRH